MTSILTNTSATIALQTLRSINQQLDTTSNRVSTGQRITSAADGAAYWAIAATLKSDNGSLSSLKDAMSLDKNSIDAASAGLNKVIDQLTSIKNALTSATSEQADKAKLQNDISVALNAIKNYSDNTVMNGSNWLSVNSSSTGFSATRNLVAAYSRTGNTVSVSKTTLDTSSFVLFDGGSAGIANTAALTKVATSSAVAAGSGYSVTVAPGTTKGFIDTTYNIGTPSNTFVTGSAVTGLAGTTVLSAAALGLTDGETLTINGKTLNFMTSGASGSNQINISDTVATLLNKIDALSGATAGTSTVSGTSLKIGTGTTSDLVIGGAPATLTKLGLSAGTTLRSTTAGTNMTIANINIIPGGVTADAGTINAYLKIVDATTQQLLTGASVLGSMSTLLKSQSDFTQQLMDINTSSIGSLVDANIEEESTKLKALQTQQQLGIQSLSIANSDAQNILSLFR
ncbi:MAG: flagellin [Methylobacterium sp.]